MGNPEGDSLLGSHIHNGRIILKQILNKWDGRTRTALGGGGLCEHVASYSVKGGKLADWLIYCYGRYNIGVGLLSVRHGASRSIKKVVRLENIRLHTHSVTAETEIRIM